MLELLLNLDQTNLPTVSNSLETVDVLIFFTVLQPS